MFSVGGAGVELTRYFVVAIVCPVSPPRCRRERARAHATQQGATIARAPRCSRVGDRLREALAGGFFWLGGGGSFCSLAPRAWSCGRQEDEGWRVGRRPVFPSGTGVPVLG